jgi:hypothetical protein
VNRLADLARSQDAVETFDAVRCDAISAAERRLVDAGADPDEAALAVNLAVASLLDRSSWSDLLAVAVSPEALALAPNDLLPSNVVRFRREPR